MFLADHSAILTFYTITPMHAGSGSATGAVDLPIQRERHTGRPIVQSSGVKGALRDAVEQKICHDWKQANHKTKQDCINKTKEICAIFGAENEINENRDRIDQAGALSVSDAKVLLFPVRSSHAPFLYVTCPSILRQLNSDLKIVGMNTLGELATGNQKQGFGLGKDLVNRACDTGGVILEDMRVGVEEHPKAEKLKEGLCRFAVPYGEDVLEKTVLLRDEDFNYIIESTCPVQTRIKLGPGGTTSESGGNLWYQELLPNDTLMYAVVFLSAEKTLQENARTADHLYDWLTKKGNLPEHIQMGGDASLGRGFCELKWIEKENRL